MKFDTRHPRKLLRTVNAVADPVIVHINARRARIILLADDVTYDSADLIRLHNTRCVYTPRGITNLIRMRGTNELFYDEVHLRRTGNYYIAVAHGLARVIAPPTEKSLPMMNLSFEHYQALINASRRRLKMAAESLLPAVRRKPSPSRLVSRALHFIGATMRHVVAAHA